jgi:protein MpaA
VPIVPFVILLLFYHVYANNVVLRYKNKKMAMLKTHIQRLSAEQRGSAAIPLQPIRAPHVNLPEWHRLKQSATRHAKRWLWQVVLHKKQVVLTFATGCVTLGIAYSASFMWPRQVFFSFGQASCTTNPVLFPNLLKQQPGSGYAADYRPSVTLAGRTIYSHTTCISLATIPRENHQDTVASSALNNSLLTNKINLTTTTFPKVAAAISADSRLPAHKPMTFSLEGGDIMFEYRLAANGLSTNCNKESATLVCELETLNLIQGQNYTIALERYYKDSRISEVYSGAITTIEPVTVVATSIAASSTVYDTPDSLTLTLNKPITTVTNLRLEALSTIGSQIIASTYEIKGLSIVITFAAPLGRETAYQLIVDQAEATDQSQLAAPYVLPFTTSGGPKVSGVSIGNYKVSPGTKIGITFDSTLLNSQDFASFVSVEANGKTVEAVVSASGNQLFVTPAALDKCVGFTVRVKPGLVNSYGVGGGQAWHYGSRTTCQTVFSIGTSVLGRNITAYRFGSGSSKIVFVGGTHGDEKSSVHTLNSLVDHLEANPGTIASSNSVIIIPNLNPDGYAQNRRTNANNVDLNRNFPANNWKSGVSMPNGEFLDYGGGTSALSEPESSALANYVLAQNPKLVLTYHSSGGMVIANESGNSWDITSNYGKKSGLWARKNSELGTTFNYDTTGAFEDWLHDKHSVPTLLIELWNDTSNHFSGQKNAFEYIISL